MNAADDETVRRLEMAVAAAEARDGLREMANRLLAIAVEAGIRHSARRAGAGDRPRGCVATGRGLSAAAQVDMDYGAME